MYCIIFSSSVQQEPQIYSLNSAMPGQVLKLGDVVPNFSADTTQGNIDFHDWIQDK